MLLEDLQKLGMSKNEATAYLSINEMGKAKAGEIIKNTGLHRNLVYTALDSLAKRRLVTKTTRGKVASFQANDPSHLLDSIREQDFVAQKVIEELKAKAIISDQDITIYEGEEGMRAYNMKNAENLKEGECIYVLGSGGEKFQKVMGPQAEKKYFSLIEQNGSAKILMYPMQRMNKRLMARIKNRPNYEVRLLPFNMTPSAGIVFTDSNVGIHIYEDPISVIEIKNQHLIKAYRDYFDVLWNQEMRIEYGMDAVRDTLNELLDELNAGEEYYVLGANVRDDQIEFNKMFDEFHRSRISKGVTVNMLCYRHAYTNISDRFAREGDPENTVSKLKTFTGQAMAPMQTFLYRNKTIMLFTGDEPAVLSFDNKDVFDSFKTYFDEVWDQTTQTLKGHKGITDLLQVVLAENKDLYLIAATGTIEETHPNEYKSFTKQRIKQTLQIHALANESKRGSHFTKMPLSNVQYLPKEFESPMVIWVFGDYVANVMWHEPQTIFLMHNKKTADYYRQYFQALKKSVAHS